MNERDQDVLDELAEHGIYVSQDFQSHCKICDQLQSLREGCCFTCAEAESIIVDGTDMYGKGPDGDGDGFKGNNGTPARTGMEKLAFLVAKGWKYGRPSAGNSLRECVGAKDE